MEAYSIYFDDCSYDEIADVIIPLLSEENCSRIANIYVQIDQNNKGLVPVNMLTKLYNVALHPGLKEGRVGIDQVLSLNKTRQ